MELGLKISAYSFIIFLVLLTQHYQVDAAGCKDDASCTDLCGFAGAGQCVNGKYCSCADCPGRSIYELARLPNICTLDPTCICPAPRFSLTNGRFYTGHRCIHGTSLVCICFCLPTTPAAIVDIVKCPFPKNGNGTTTTAAPQNGTSTTAVPPGDASTTAVSPSDASTVEVPPSNTIANNA